MRKRIYLNFLVLILLCVVMLSAAVSGIFYDVMKKQEMAAIRDRAQLAADLLNHGLKATGDRFTDYSNYSADTARITVIAPDGTVLLDNRATAASMENHGGRQEFRQAIETGFGEITRFSTTLRTDTYYYAIRLDDGNVLRVSKTMGSIVGVFGSVLPALIGVAVLILLVANIVAHRLTKKILHPLEWIDFSGENVAAYDELIPYMKKIDQQKREINAQIAALKNRADTIEVITGNLKEGLILIDKEGIVLISNKSAEDIFNDTEMAQKSILHVCRDMEFQQGVRQCLSGANMETVLHRGGNIYNVYFNPVLNGDRIGGGIILLFDITGRYESEKQRREFSANVSHELKTPLTSISALAEMIENGMAKEDDIKGFAGKISIQAKRLISIIEDIIRLSEFDENKTGRNYTEFDLYELAGSVIETLRDEANRKHVAVSVSGESLRIDADKNMIDELLFNLIDNAIKYNKENGAVSVTLSTESGFCKIVVSDTGIGIPGKHLSRVFERFYRVDKSRSKKTGGTGLGLSISKHIAEHHGGRIALESEEGRGTTVVCWIATP